MFISKREKKLARKYHSRKEKEFNRRLEMATDSQVDSSQRPLKSLVGIEKVSLSTATLQYSMCFDSKHSWLAFGETKLQSPVGAGRTNSGALDFATKQFHALKCFDFQRKAKQ